MKSQKTDYKPERKILTCVILRINMLGTAFLKYQSNRKMCKGNE